MLHPVPHRVERLAQQLRIHGVPGFFPEPCLLPTCLYPAATASSRGRPRHRRTAIPTAGVASVATSAASTTTGGTALVHNGTLMASRRSVDGGAFATTAATVAFNRAYSCIGGTPVVLPLLWWTRQGRAPEWRWRRRRGSRRPCGRRRISRGGGTHSISLPRLRRVVMVPGSAAVGSRVQGRVENLPKKQHGQFAKTGCLVKEACACAVLESTRGAGGKMLSIFSARCFG